MSGAARGVHALLWAMGSWETVTTPFPVAPLLHSPAQSDNSLSRCPPPPLPRSPRFTRGFPEVYLHSSTPAAGRLYAKLGYEPLPHWDEPRWKEENLGLVPFRYHRKVISTDPSYVPYADETDVCAASAPAREPTLGFAV